jgi:hypothetical protein
MFGDVLEVRILIVVEHTVKKILIIEMLFKGTSVESNRLEPQRFAYFFTIIIRHFARIMVS